MLSNPWFYYPVLIGILLAIVSIVDAYRSNQKKNIRRLSRRSTFPPNKFSVPELIAALGAFIGAAQIPQIANSPSIMGLVAAIAILLGLTVVVIFRLNSALGMLKTDGDYTIFPTPFLIGVRSFVFFLFWVAQILLLILIIVFVTDFESETQTAKPDAEPIQTGEPQ